MIISSYNVFADSLCKFFVFIQNSLILHDIFIQFSCHFIFYNSYLYYIFIDCDSICECNFYRILSLFLYYNLIIFSSTLIFYQRIFSFILTPSYVISVWYQLLNYYSHIFSIRRTPSDLPEEGYKNGKFLR